jgi:flagellar basal body-associated protein FliL
MPFQGNTDNSRIPRLRQRKTLLIIAAIIIAATMFAVIFFFVDENNESENTNTKYLPSDCYLLNGKIICPNK